MDGPVLRRCNGYEIRNAEGLYWDSAHEIWVPIGTRWSGFSRREMWRLAREVGGVVVRLTLVRRSRIGRTAIRCPECAARHAVGSISGSGTSGSTATAPVKGATGDGSS